MNFKIENFCEWSYWKKEETSYGVGESNYKSYIQQRISV
jgi:hypothetical protein